MKSTLVHRISLKFNDTPEDQGLYAALSASSDHECRTPLSRHIKYLLKYVLRLAILEQRLESLESAVQAAAAYVPSPPQRPTLRLMPPSMKGGR